MRYFIEKKKYTVENVDRMDIVFQNGNFLQIGKEELIDVQLHLYDRLVRFRQGASFAAESGRIQLKIHPQKQTKYDRNAFLHDPKKYIADRKAYIENRCIGENDVDYIVLFDNNSWLDTVFGDIRCQMDGDSLVLQFVPNEKYGPASSDKAYIDLPDVSKKKIRRVDVDFENCDGVTVYEDEILNLDLCFEERLERGGGDYFRQVKSGIFQFKFDKAIKNRDVTLISSKRKTIKGIAKRICEKKEDVHDICHLSITYDYVGYRNELEEKIEISDMRVYEEAKPLYYDEEIEDYIYGEGIDIFIGGYVKEERDGTFTVKFGKCCAADVTRVVEKKKYPVKIKDYSNAQESDPSSEG